MKYIQETFACILFNGLLALAELSIHEISYIHVSNSELECAHMIRQYHKITMLTFKFHHCHDNAVLVSVTWK